MGYEDLNQERVVYDSNLAQTKAMHVIMTLIREFLL